MFFIRIKRGGRAPASSGENQSYQLFDNFPNKEDGNLPETANGDIAHVAWIYGED